MKELIFNCLVGIIGSGKSTYALELLKKDLEAVWICPDNIREELTGDMTDQSCNAKIFNYVVPHRLAHAYKSGKSIIYDATNYNRKNRKGVLECAQTLGYKVILHVMQTPFEQCWTNNLGRNRKVPRFVYDKMVAGWQEPDMEIEPYIDEIKKV